MTDKIIETAFRQRFLTLLLGAGMAAYGLFCALRLNVAAFPDVTNVQVQINTEAPGLASVEVEKLITFPIESVMNGLPSVTEVRSISKTSLSVVTVVFEDDVDIYLARQLVLERLQAAKERIPKGLGEPEMGPISTGMGQIYKYILVGEGKSAMELRTLNDWVVKFQLRTVPGVTDVLSFGGEVRQYQVLVDPERLFKHKLALSDLRRAIQANNTNAGGWYIEGEQEQLAVRGVGLIRGGEDGVSDIRNIVLKSAGGVPVYVRDVADVRYGPEIRQGAVTMDGKGEVVSGIVLQLKGANTKKVINGIRRKLRDIQAALPEGVRIVPVYDQADLVEKAVGTVADALTESALLIVGVLFLFLWNARSALVVVSSIPLSMLFAFIMMRWNGISANLQSLGGLAVGIGMMVDGSVVMVENVVRHLGEAEHHGEPAPRRVLAAAQEVGRPVFFAVLIIVVVFLPLFTLQGIEGKLFGPMAFTIAFAMLGSLAVALTVIPALCAVAFRGELREKESFLMSAAGKAYRPVLDWALAHRGLTVGCAAAALAASFAALPFLGTEFVPELDEGAMTIRVTMGPSVSLEEAKRIATRLESRLMTYPEVTYAMSNIGRAEIGGDPESVANNEIFVGLKPQKEWKTARSREGLIRAFEEDLGRHPGILLNFSQPIATRVDELLSGIKAQIAVKLFGEDLDVLDEKGRQIESVIQTVRGSSDVQMEQISGETQLVVRADRAESARYGLNVEDVMEVVSTAVGGEAVTDVLEGQRRFAVYLRLAEPYRNSEKAVRNLWVSTKDGVRVPLSRVADIRLEEGPPMVSREDAQRRVVVLCNVRGRDMGGFVAEARRAVRNRVKLPPGYFVTWGGQFENQQRAQRTLMVVVPVCLGLILLLLYMSFGSPREALLIIMNVPFSLIGGVFALAVSRQYLSVPSSVGFIALFGVAVLNGVVMVSYFNQLVRQRLPVEEAVRRGALMRLRPVLMTATVASLGLIPLLLSTGVGSEVQRPLATVVVGGLVSSTLLTLVVLPVVYAWAHARHAGVLQEPGNNE